jgi:hypothetical protein
MNTDTPLPPDEPVGENPPDGAMIDYYLPADASGIVTIEIKDDKGNVVRRYASNDPPPKIDEKKLRIPTYWIRPPQPLSATRGLHRFLWDMHYAPIAAVDPEFPMNAIVRNTAPEPTGPWAPPAEYSVALTGNGKTYTQPLTLKMDPRVKASAADVAEQFALSKQLYDVRPQLEKIGAEFSELNTAVTKAKERPNQNRAVTQQLDAFAKTLSQFAPANPRPFAPLTFDLLTKVQSLFSQLQDVDAAPRPIVKAAVADVTRDVPQAIERWQKVVAQDLPALNAQLTAAGVEPIALKSEPR